MHAILLGIVQKIATPSRYADVLFIIHYVAKSE